MRVLIAGVTYSPTLNGQAIFTTNLAEGLVKYGHQVLVVFPANQDVFLPQIQNGVQLVPLKSMSLEIIHEGTFVPVNFERALVRILNDFQPDIIHVQDHYPQSVSVVRLAHRHGIKVIGTNHFMPENIAPYVPILSRIKPLYDWLAWRWVLDVYNRTDIVTAQSQAAAEILRLHGLRRPIYSISCGIDLQHFRQNPSINREACRARYQLDTTKTVFLFVGRVDREKRLETVIQAFHVLKRQDIELAIAGTGAAVGELRTLVHQLNEENRVHFLGPISTRDLPILLNSIDIFVMPSTAELLSIATLEAMACSRPVLLANAGALSGLVKQPNTNGYLFKPGDASDAARFIELLADQRHLWEAMGENSRLMAQAHSLEKTISQYEILYEELLGKAHFFGRDLSTEGKEPLPLAQPKKGKAT